ncbi:DUF3828 domain-containing protein [Flavobacterium sp.]|uniref:DUF3828 domain-containing protein n=1 Tax=Flavobacterium sp. TaxID=239 RepID=UPI0012086B89|nr:DUF3828 domain-containing protein [Flavobacterium sp.]RZJ73332.1 MAG: DUF3828 domain-containing protein [Flavobacterium sp.]
MKKHLIVLILALSAFLSVSSFAQKASDKEAKIKMLKDFYTEYITASAKEPSDQKEIDAIKKKYCTAKFLKELDAKLASGELDYDIFVSAQDYDVEWLKSLKIESAATFNVFRVTYDMGYEDDQALIRPVVTKEKGKFKIDNIKTD